MYCRSTLVIIRQVTHMTTNSSTMIPAAKKMITTDTTAAMGATDMPSVLGTVINGEREGTTGCGLLVEVDGRDG